MNLFKPFSVMLMTVILMFSISSQARPGKGKGKGQWKNMMKELNLTEDQKAKMKEIKKSKPDNKQARDNIKNMREQLKASLKTSTSDADLIKLHGEIQTARNKMATERFNHMLKIRAILTPEQRSKFHEMREGRHGKGGPDDDDDD